MKVAITDYTFPSLEIEQAILEPEGCTVVSGQCRTPEDLIALTADADAVITQFAPMNAEVVQALQRARIIVRYGIGYDNVACDVARERAIPVCNIPEFCIDEVADHTVGFILSATRSLRANSEHMVQGNWGLAVPLTQMRALRDMTIGLVGFGRIGRAVAARLTPFGCRMLVFDPAVDEAPIAAAGCIKASWDTLLESSDLVSLHCPSNEHTRGMLNTETLARMQAGSIVVNVGRGDLVCLDALTAALQSGHLSAAALDVFNPEPLPSDSPLLSMPQVLVTSHIASASPRAAQTLRETAARQALAALRGEPLSNVVNGVTA
ncbi:MAG TPA: C-terminal binding protein [Planctomycetaceae bacterium]|nr:hydroxyacid dehydrogenase [Blastopirellula sp.]HAY83040.1 C-terminal binding protein [Planctomycetaceae bacterium]